jgi:hypothetical protein
MAAFWLAPALGTVWMKMDGSCLGLWRVDSFVILAPSNAMPPSFVPVKENQLQAKANGREYETAADIAKDDVSQGKAHEVAEGLPG